MTEHTPGMFLLKIGMHQLQWWSWDSDEYIDGIRAGHFVGPSFEPPCLKFVKTACNCHADLLEALKAMLLEHGPIPEGLYDGGRCQCGACTLAREAIRKTEEQIR